MQVKKEDIREKIISAARKEFLELGYTKASLRNIAEKAGLTKGAVYSYFDNKDTLFCEIAEPAMSFIDSEFKNNNDCFASKYNDSSLESYQATIEGFQRYAQVVFNHYDSFKMLLFCSAGSSLQNYRERIIQLYAQSFHKFFSFITKTDHRKATISEMFVHTLATTYVSFLEELVLHEPDINEANDYAMQMAVFIRSGFEKLYAHQRQG